MKTIIRAMLAMAMFGVAANSYAATDTGTLDPSLTLTGDCSIAVTNAPFTTLVASTAAGSVVTQQIGTVDITGCNGSAFKLGAGAGGASYLTTRFLTVGDAGTHGVTDVPYTLNLKEGAASVVGGLDWGDANLTVPGSPATSTNAYSKAADLLGPYSYTVDGTFTVPASPVAGVFIDSVLVTVEF